MSKIRGSADNWERGKLGTSVENAVAATVEETDAINKAVGLNMQLISMRLPHDLLTMLKEIARYHGVGYQPMVRDLLHRWAVGEIRTILEARLKETKKLKTEIDKVESLAGDLRKTA